MLSEGNVRVSLPPGTPAEDVDRFLEVLPGAVVGGARASWARRCRRPATGRTGRTSLVVDALGKRCPIPVIELAKVIGDVPVGGTVRVLVRRRGGPAGHPGVVRDARAGVRRARSRRTAASAYVVRRSS